MSDAPITPVETTAREPRSAGAVFSIVGAIIAIPLLVVLVILLLHGTKGASRGGGDLLDGVRSNRIQSVDLSNGRLYYGRLREGQGDWVVLTDAYFIRRAAPAAGKDASSGTPELVKLQDEQGGDGDLSINTREIVSVQDLKADSQIGSKIEDATK
jgi:hypothetical protein